MARLAFLIPDMNGGGAERVALTLIQGFVERGHEVDLVLLDARGPLLSLVPKQVRIVDLKADRMRNAVPPLVRYLRARKPDALQASMWPVTVIAILARIVARVPVRLLVSDHSNISVQFRRERLRIKLIGWSIRAFYPFADVRLCVSQDVAADIAAVSGLPPERFEIVHNPIEQRATPTSPTVEGQWRGQGRRILNVGALKWAKDQLLLIEAFARLHRRERVSLMILGEGELRPVLEQRIVDLGIQDAVAMPGFVLDPGPFYASADLFVLSSDFEGFANVLVEAMAAGLPVVSTNCRSGPQEVLADGEYGRLVPVGNVEALAVAMEQALAEEPDRGRLKARAWQFRPEIAIERYLELMLA